MKERCKYKYKYHQKKKVGFGRIWLATAVPILLIAIAAMIVMSDVFFIALMLKEQLRVSEVAYETTLILRKENTASLKDCSEVLDLEKYQMTAALYDGEGNLICQSNVGGYDNWRHISRENYVYLLKRLKEIPMTDRRENAGYEQVDVFGISYLYGRKYFTADEKTYILRYGALISPWNRHERRFIASGFGILLCALALSTIIAGHYYRIYRERIKVEEYYRNTSNALAHDLKTPLMAISGYAEILQENVHTEKRNYYAEGIMKNVAVMDSIIENMLELAKLENPEIILVKEEIDLRKLTEEALEQFQVEIQSKELKIQIQGADESIVSADKSLMKRALENLISNAVKYTPEGNEIIITMDRKEYQIKNTGVMIPENKLAHVWEPFVKGEGARANVQGTGIGLTIVREIMDLHGFVCSIENEENSVMTRLCFHNGYRHDFQSKKVKIDI